MKQLVLITLIALFASMATWAQTSNDRFEVETNPVQSLQEFKSALQSAEADVELSEILSEVGQAQFSQLSAEVWSRKLTEQSEALEIDANGMLEASRNRLRLKAGDITKLQIFEPIEAPFYKPVFDPETGEITEFEVKDIADLDRESALKAIELLEKACGGSSACDPNPPPPTISPKPRQPEPVINDAACQKLCGRNKKYCPKSCQGGKDD